jgi:hypothetical protein
LFKMDESISLAFLPNSFAVAFTASPVLFIAFEHSCQVLTWFDLRLDQRCPQRWTYSVLVLKQFD